MTKTASDSLTDPTWAKPGPGTWELDKSHFSPDVSRVCRDLMEHAMTAGMREGMEVLQGPLDTLEARFVNGRMYTRMVNLIAGDKDLPPPPAPVLWLATRLHPTFRKRNKGAKRTLENRAWLDELNRWETEWKPDIVARSRALVDTKIADLTDPELASHIEDAYDHVKAGAVLHFRLHVSDLGPIGYMLVKVMDWGFEPAEIMAMLAGSSPATSAPGAAISQLRDLLAANDSSPTTVDEIRQHSPRAAELLDAFLAEYGHRLTTGYDIQALTLAEMPDVLLSTLKAEPVPTSDEAQKIGNDAVARLKAKLPAEHHAELDEMLSDARALYGLRDENGPITYQWPAGLLRRALLESAERLQASGAISDPGQIFDLQASEVAGLLRGNSTPAPAEIQERQQHRKAWADLEPPEVLGKPQDPPPAWVMPEHLGEMMRMVLSVMELLETRETETSLQGVGVGNATYRGTARVVTNADDAMVSMEPGDILVAPFTVPTYNAVLAMAGAVVVEHGGILCHAAVIAREYGIPGVVGANRATTEIPNGATIEVDPVAGCVRLVN